MLYFRYCTLEQASKGGRRAVVELRWLLEGRRAIVLHEADCSSVARNGWTLTVRQKHRDPPEAYRPTTVDPYGALSPILTLAVVLRFPGIFAAGEDPLTDKLDAHARLGNCKCYWPARKQA